MWNLDSESELMPFNVELNFSYNKGIMLKYAECAVYYQILQSSWKTK